MSQSRNSSDSDRKKEAQESNRHHFVPQFYLRRWAGIDGKVQVFRTENERHVPTRRYHPKSVARSHELYTIFSGGNWRFQGEERVFRKLDNDAALAFERLVDHGDTSLERDLADAFYRFIYTLQLRNPKTLESITQGVDDTFDEIRRSLPTLQPQALERFRASASDRDHGKAMTILLAMHDTSYLSIFGSIPMVVRRFQSGQSLLTSDYPFLAQPKFAEPNTLYVLPMSPHHAFMASRNEGVLRYFQNIEDERLTSSLNFLIVARASTVFATDAALEVPIRKYLGMYDNDREQTAKLWPYMLRGDVCFS